MLPMWVLAADLTWGQLHMGGHYPLRDLALCCNVNMNEIVIKCILVGFITRFFVHVCVCSCVMNSIHGEAVVVGNMPSTMARRGALVVLATAAPSLLPVGYAGVWAVVFVVPFVDNHTGFVAPFAVYSLVRWGKCKQALVPCVCETVSVLDMEWSYATCAL